METILIIVMTLIIVALLFKGYQYRKSKENISVKGTSTGKAVANLEDKIAFKFTEILNTLSSDNINEVKTKLINCLDEYKAAKMNQFIESEVLIDRALRDINSSKIENDKTMTSLKNEILNLKNKKGSLTESDKELGAQYVHDYECIKSVNQQLTKTEEVLTEKLNKVQSKVKMFNSKFAQKKSQVTMMIVNSISINDSTPVDIKLDDLISEFEDKTAEAKIRDEVMTQINGIENSSSDVFDKSEYINKFEHFK